MLILPLLASGKGHDIGKDRAPPFRRFWRVEARMCDSRRPALRETLMTTLLYTHAACLEHDPGPHHPECPARLRAVLEGLADPEFAALERRDAPLADLEDIARVHPRPYIEQVLAAVPKSGHAALDADTALSPGSGKAALRAVGAVCAAIDAVIGGEAANAFCATRPPGHHAEARRAMGFCLFNNIAIGAQRARQAHGLDRVAVIDFDVHHGNGTQAIFEDDASLFYGSTHQWPLYPGSGAQSETGVGNIVNVPLRPMSGSVQFRHGVAEHILPALDDFRPDFILVSAGFDAHRRDPLAQLDLDESDYAWVTERLVDCAARHCAGRLVSTLEGGYDFTALRTSAAAHVRVLMAA
jgi:acetoin utilization deacetylase AcuC-like enzyme